MSLGEGDLTAGPAEAAGLLSNARQDAPSPQALTVAPAGSGPLISGPASLLWTGVGAVLLIFFLAFFILLRSRMGRASAARERTAPRETSQKRQRKPLKTDFFEPAGEDAEITFDDEPPRPLKASHPPLPPAAHPKAHQGDLATTAEEEAEVVIERPDDAPPPKPGAFAGLFAKKEQPEAETAAAASLVKIKSHPLASERQRAQEEPGDAPARRLFGDDISLERRPGPDDGARLLAEERAAEDRRLAAERADAERRRLEAEEAERERARRAAADRAASETARLAAEREAEFERRKKAAALEQRERELAQWAEELAGENNAFRRGMGDEVDRRFTALSERLEEKVRDLSASARSAPEIAAAIAALRRDLDQRLFEINERLEARLVGAAEAAGAGDASGENVAAMAEMVSRRIADHRESINATIAALSNRIDSFAGAAEEVAALRKDISSLKRAIGERAHGPNAPMVQLADLVRNSLPPDAFELRASLANNRKADCLIRLPYPPGPIAIDARFPVEAFQALFAAGESDKTRAENEFRRVALRHVVDIAERLIVPEETAESALMFIPSESMYATLHERFPDIVQDSYRARVWIVSPTTLMATLHTVRAVMRDAQARESAELIHTEAQHVLAEVDALRRRVIKLEEDFGRAHHDVRDVLSGADQVFRRAESISKTHRTLADEMLARGSKRIISVDEPEPAPEDDAADEAPPSPDRQPFPLR